MPVYLVTPLARNADQVGEAVKKHITPDDAYELQGRSGWLVFHRGTSMELSNAIGVTSPEGKPQSDLGPAMVTSIGSYYGLGSTAMWEWLKTRFERQA
jgi:hypothetical protein